MGAAGLLSLFQARTALWAREAPGLAADLRDEAVARMRRTDLQPAWFTSSNWGNRAYDPWTDYVSGRMSDDQFQRACPQPTDYCLRDTWNLRREALPRGLQRSADPNFNWSGIHALALRYFRTGDPVYVRKWLQVVQYYAEWSASEAARPDSAANKGEPPTLLLWGVAWGGIFTAMSVIAKGMPSPAGQPPAGASPFAPQTAPVQPGVAAQLFPSEEMVAIAEAFVNGAAPLLLRWYSQERYVPNQRIFGLEAVAYACAFFPRLNGVAALERNVHVPLRDVFIRYRQRDGGQLEQSFNYAQDVAHAARRLSALPFQRDPDWRGDAEQTATGWDRMLAAIAVPEGGWPQLGNAAWARGGRDIPPQRFAVPSIALPYSGFYAMRSDWSPQAAYLFMFVRRASRGHSMAGSNSVQVSAFGRQLIAAGGSASYNAASKGRGHPAAYLSEESTFKTSTVVVDGLSQRGGSMQGLNTDAQGRPDVTVAPGQPLRGRWHSSANFDLAEGIYDQGYDKPLEGGGGAVNDVTHVRQVVFLRPLMAWAIVDVLRTGGSHRYTQIWKFSAPRNGLSVPGFDRRDVEAIENARLIRTRDEGGSAVNVTLQQFGTMRPEYRMFFGEGQFGWFNPGPLTDPVPAVDVHANWSGRGPQVLVTLLIPHRGRLPEGTLLRDISTDRAAGFEAQWANGSRVALSAAASPTHLRAGNVEEDNVELLALIEPAGRPRAVLALGARNREITGGQETAIIVPRGFQWARDGDALRPVYS